MRSVVTLVLTAAVALSLRPAVAQSPGAATMPPGTQNPAFVQPQLVPPPGGPLSPSPPQPGGLEPASQPGGLPPASTPNQPAPSALITPDSAGAGGLCECLINHDSKLTVFDKTKMHQSCLGSVEACRAACATDHYYSFVPHAVYTCPGPSGPAAGHIAMNMRPAMRLLSSRQ